MSPAASAVLREAARLGIDLCARGTKIIARPRGALTPAFADEIRLHRDEILVALRESSAAPEIEVAESERPLAGVPPPKRSCSCCHGSRFFARPERLTWICARCHPPALADEMVWHEVPAATAECDAARIVLERELFAERGVKSDEGAS